MTINLVKCMKSILKGVWPLLVCALVKTTFKRAKSWFVEWGTKTACMLRASHQYPEDIIVLLRKNQQQYVMCHIQRYNRGSSIWSLGANNFLTSTLTYVIYSQTKWLVVWLWGVSSSVPFVCSYYCYLFSMSFTTNDIC